MAHGGAEVVVPVGSVNGVVAVEVHDVGDIFEEVVVAQQVAVHCLAFMFEPGAELAGDGGMVPGSAGDEGGVNGRFPLIGHQRLGGQVNINPMFTLSNTGRSDCGGWGWG